MTHKETDESQTIRLARIEDAPAIAPLSAQLGYPANTPDVAKRLAQILPDSRQLVAVAEVSGQIVGWIHAAWYLTLESGEAVEIRGMVVEEERRGAGLGRALLVHAEQWARERGARVIRLRSNVIRAGAHAFYKRLGYSIVKTQHAFRKNLDPE